MPPGGRASRPDSRAECPRTSRATVARPQTKGQTQLSPVICRCACVRSPSPLAAAARPCRRRNAAVTTPRRAMRGVLPRLERLAGARGEAARPRPTDKAAPLHLSNARRGRDPAARQGRNRRQSRSRPRRRGRPAVGPRGDRLAATKKRLRRWQSASASWLTSLVGRVRERGGPRPVRWETGAGARGAEGRSSAPSDSYFPDLQYRKMR